MFFCVLVGHSQGKPFRTIYVTSVQRARTIAVLSKKVITVVDTVSKGQRHGSSLVAVQSLCVRQSITASICRDRNKKLISDELV